jgi:tRNA A-37 threonylcarbamoyl transferase component Bud32
MVMRQRTAPPSDRADTLGRMSLPTFPRHSTVSALGSGGFAEVYRARREGHLERWVAIKLFRVTLDDRRAAARFRDECAAITRLDTNPDVVTVHDADVLPDGRPYLVMELCEGSLLRAVQQRGPLPPAEIGAIGLRIATALDTAHFAHVLHGDVSPQNVLFRRTGTAALADFGLAVLRDHRGNVASGFTIAHAAPEAVRHDGTIGERSDVYGLGSTLHHALTGQPPFPPRPGESDVARTNRILHDPPPRATTAPAWLADVVQRMLAKDPAERPSTGEVVAVLAQHGPDLDAPGPDAPVYGPPPGFEPASSAHTRDRPGAGRVAEEPSAEATRLRAGRPDREAPAEAPVRRWLRPLLAGVAVLALAGAAWSVAVVVGGDGGTSGPTPQSTAPQAADSAIRLSAPQDNGDSVTLTWTVDRPLADVGVAVSRDGAAPVVARIPRNGTTVATTTTVPAEAGTPFCFQIQGYSVDGTTYQSNRQPVRGEACAVDPS